MEAFVRPSPIATAGIATSYTFDLANCSFLLKLDPIHEKEEYPTEVFIPDYFFRGGAEPEITISSGSWIMIRQAQVLKWWHHGSDEQSLKVSSGYRHTGMEESVDDSGYYLGLWVGRLTERCT
jgi:Glycoside hydrolase family 5 C-terminal domain